MAVHAEARLSSYTRCGTHLECLSVRHLGVSQDLAGVSALQRADRAAICCLNHQLEVRNRPALHCTHDPSAFDGGQPCQALESPEGHLTRADHQTMISLCMTPGWSGLRTMAVPLTERHPEQTPASTMLPHKDTWLAHPVQVDCDSQGALAFPSSKGASRCSLEFE